MGPFRWYSVFWISVPPCGWQVQFFCPLFPVTGVVLSFPKCLFGTSFHLLKWQSERGGIFQLLVLYPNVHHNQGWVRPKPGACSSIQVGYVCDSGHSTWIDPLLGGTDKNNGLTEEYLELKPTFQCRMWVSQSASLTCWAIITLFVFCYLRMLMLCLILIKYFIINKFLL